MLKQLIFAALFGHAASRPTGTSSVVAGRGFSFIVNDGTAFAAGSNTYGQLGYEGKNETFTPVDLDGSVDMIAAGAFHSLFLMADGTVYATGRNKYGQLGFTERKRVGSTPEVVEVDGANISEVAAGYSHSLFLTDQGKVWAAGYNNVGQLGDGTLISRSTPVEVQGLPGKVAAIAAGYDFSYFLMESGKVFATGQNLGGQLGDNTETSKSTPVEVLVSDVTSIAVGQSHALFVSSNIVKTTGANHLGQLGDNTLQSAASPKTALTYSGQISAGGDSSCLIESSLGGASVFGSNLDGQIGMEDESFVSTPNIVKYGILSASIGEAHSLLIDNTGSVWASGSNKNGEFGGEFGVGLDSSKTFTKIFKVTIPEQPTSTTLAVTVPITTREPLSPSTPSADNTMLIIVGVIGALVLVVLLGVCGSSNTNDAPAQNDTPLSQEMVPSQVQPEMSV
jgi:alpha-tubulin suppressor-like RCC1 family protein